MINAENLVAVHTHTHTHTRVYLIDNKDNFRKVLLIMWKREIV